MGGLYHLYLGNPDVTFRHFLDPDGAKMRCPQPTVLVAADSARNAALESPETLTPDFHEVRSARIGRGSPLGGAHRIVVHSSRAGETYASRSLVLDFEDIASDDRPQTADTTARTDGDGATIKPATWRGFGVADSQRNAALVPMPGSDQDAYHVSFAAEPTDAVGFVHRIVNHGLGRAGEAGASLALVLDFADGGEPGPRGDT